MRKWQVVWMFMGIIAIILISQTELSLSWHLIAAGLLGGWIAWTGNLLFDREE